MEAEEERGERYLADQVNKAKIFNSAMPAFVLHNATTQRLLLVLERVIDGDDCELNLHCRSREDDLNLATAVVTIN